ncbi:cytidylyltransferase [Cenarchaeum symbiosum A]|uniref:Cytidylyltransferase n=1 Tax=Cenarchaeum symbiosum (strain A) TaxID=414004 RepID=A0RTV5_CENSY|nr:cytidylyltransferase [Cenarchaeum symbiosum A]
MDAIDNLILSSIYVSSLDGSEPLAAARKSMIPEDMLQERMASLASRGAIENNALTELGRSSLRVVFAGGVFDIIHPGHIHTLNAAKKLGDILVVTVATDSTVKKMKKHAPLHTQEQRKDLVSSLHMVDLCLVGDERDMFRTVEKVRPDVIALGYDQVHQEKYVTDGCSKLGLSIAVARLQSPVPEISSSTIEKEYGEAIHDT